jgi:hypothetical protein
MNKLVHYLEKNTFLVHHKLYKLKLNMQKKWGTFLGFTNHHFQPEICRSSKIRDKDKNNRKDLKTKDQPI